MTPTDHDKIIRHEANMVTVCEFMKKIEDKLDDVIEKKVDTGLFWKVILIMVSVMIISGGVVVANKTSLVEHEVCIKLFQEKVK